MSKIQRLSAQNITRLHEVVLLLGIDRTTLLGGIRADLVATIPICPNASAQVLADLHFLNGVGYLGDESDPFATWLSNALVLAGARKEVGFIEECRTLLSVSKPPQNGVSTIALTGATTAVSVPKNAPQKKIAVAITVAIGAFAISWELSMSLSGHSLPSLSSVPLPEQPQEQPTSSVSSPASASALAVLASPVSSASVPSASKPHQRIEPIQSKICRRGVIQVPCSGP